MGLSKYHASLAFQSGVDQEEDKKEVCSGVASEFSVKLEVVHYFNSLKQQKFWS